MNILLTQISHLELYSIGSIVRFIAIDVLFVFYALEEVTHPVLDDYQILLALSLDLFMTMYPPWTYFKHFFRVIGITILLLYSTPTC